jgi:exodeoxyribonuclease VII small subunit
LIVPKKPKADESIEVTDGATPSFEAAVAQLAEIVEQLESGELPLESALQLFEQGTRLVKQSQTMLNRAERRVEQLLGFDENGKPVTAALDGAALDNDEDGALE